MQVEGIGQISAPNTSPRIFAETGDLEFLGTHRDHWSWARLLFLSTCAIMYAMRLRERHLALHRGGGGWLEFFDEKVNREWVTYPCPLSLKLGEHTFTHANIP